MLQAPVASDARLVTGVLDATVDLELIGDYAYEIVTLTSGIHGRPPVSSIVPDVIDWREGSGVSVDSDRGLADSRSRYGPFRAPSASTNPR